MVKTNILESKKGFDFYSGKVLFSIPNFKVDENSFYSFSPESVDYTSDLTTNILLIMTGIEQPLNGDISLFGKILEELDYCQKLKLRGKMGFIHNKGGLFANKTVYENIAYPLTVNHNLTNFQIKEKVESFCDSFGLTKFLNLRPHLIDGFVKWRVCAARALIVSPKLLIMEENGNWSKEAVNENLVWQEIVKLKSNMTTIIVNSKRNIEFNQWISDDLNGKNIYYK